ncbi:MAG: hypothetical protein Q4D62_13540, partial [Planctomycetia bacterium]|nr:hypothetical protein [Planctomycetia bacterium]
ARRCNEKKAKLPFNRERYQLRNIAERIFLKINSSDESPPAAKNCPAITSPGSKLLSLNYR